MRVNRAAVLTGPPSFAVPSQPLPDLQSSRVRVRLQGCGVCGSNLPVGEGRGVSFRKLNGSFYDFVAGHLLPDRSRRSLAEPPDAWGGKAAVDWARQLAQSPNFGPDIQHVVSVAETLDHLYGKTTS